MLQNLGDNPKLFRVPFPEDLTHIPKFQIQIKLKNLGAYDRKVSQRLKRFNNFFSNKLFYILYLVHAETKKYEI